MSRTDVQLPTEAGHEPSSRYPIARAGAGSGVVAAVLTTAVAAVAGAADVPFEADGETIPLGAFAILTLGGAVFGCIMAVGFRRFVARPRRWFVATAVGLTALSLLPSVLAPPDAATSMVLVATHLLAALVIVPALAWHLPEG